MKIAGTVIKGKAMGRLLGFPTANLEISEPVNLESGVYLAETFLNHRQYHSLAVIGTAANPEIWLNDFSGDLYGQTLSVEIGQKISEIINQPDQQSLIAKIKKDVALAKQLWQIN